MLNNIGRTLGNSLDVEILTDKEKFPGRENMGSGDDYVGVRLKRNPQHEVDVWFYFIESRSADIYDGTRLDAYAALCMDDKVVRTYEDRIGKPGTCGQKLQQANFYGQKEELKIINMAKREALKFLQKREKANQKKQVQSQTNDDVAKACREFLNGGRGSI